MSYAYADQPFAARFGAMGDEAETKFDELFPSNHKLGLNRPPMHVASMSQNARYTPDRLVTDGFVECMGIGNDQTLKLKAEKLAALWAWSLIDAVQLFVWDRKNKRWWLEPIAAWNAAIQAHATHGEFSNDKKQFWGLHTNHFPGTPHAI